jgi:two-component system, NtrC family, sensor histidine kinase GlrK
MRLNYPRSFLSLIVVGFAIVALPLALGLIANAISLEQLADRSAAAVQRAVRVTELSRDLSGFVPSIARNARQYAATGEPDLAAAYKTSRSTFLSFARQLRQEGSLAAPLSSPIQRTLQSIEAKESDIAQFIDTLKPGEQAAEDMRKRFDDVASLSAQLNDLANRGISEEVMAMRKASGDAKNRVLWQMAAMIPTAMLLIAGYIFLISRPITQLETAVRALGDGQLRNNIRVEGPQDMVALGERLDWLRKKLLELEEQKTKFLQHISHELKTPLTALREGSDLLSTEVVGKLNPEQREVAQILQANSIELRRLIEDLLNYSAVSGQNFKRDDTIVQMRDVIGNVLKAQKLQIVSKNMQVRLNAEKVTAYLDSDKFRVIVDNLVSNAVKYSPEGGMLTIRLFKSASHAVLEVSDDGPGIPKAVRDKVFDPFYRGDAPTRTLVKGTGLGLSIVKEFVKLHQGTIEVFDPPIDPPKVPRGAHFRVTLPRKPQDANEKLPAAMDAALTTTTDLAAQLKANELGQPPSKP